MTGIVDKEARDGCLYKPGNWEYGGWFARSQSAPLSYTTKPDPTKSGSTMIPPGSYGNSVDSSQDKITQEQDRLSNLQKNAPDDPFTQNKSWGFLLL